MRYISFLKPTKEKNFVFLLLVLIFFLISNIFPIIPGYVILVCIIPPCPPMATFTRLGRATKNMKLLTQDLYEIYFFGRPNIDELSILMLIWPIFGLLIELFVIYFVACFLVHRIEKR